MADVSQSSTAILGRENLFVLLVSHDRAELTPLGSDWLVTSVKDQISELQSFLGIPAGMQVHRPGGSTLNL